MKRLILLTNSAGETLNLSELDHLALKVNGLGFGMTHDQYADGPYSVHSKSEQKLEDCSISLLFGVNDRKAYESFFKFSAFLNHQPLIMSYQVDGVEEYLRDCRFVNLTKSERIEGLFLEETFNLSFSGPWYQWQEGSLAEYVNQEGDGKIYGEWLYGYVYEDNFTDGRYYFLLENKSQYFGLQSSSPLEITITAGQQEIRNPSWAIYQDGKIVQSDGYFTTIKPNGSLVVSSSPGAQIATLYTPNDRPRNVYQQQDIAKTNFVKAPIGESLLLFENCAGATIRYRLRQEAVLI